MKNKTDVVIIGGGPAGITASIYLHRQNINFTLITKDIGGQMWESGLVENYPGFISTTGVELTETFEKQIKNLNINILNDEVINLNKRNKIFKITCRKNEIICKSVIICVGKKHKHLNIEGEAEYKHKGMVYCTVCDGPLYKNKTIAIIGGGNSALDSASYMLNIAEKIYIVNKNSNMKGDKILLEKLSQNKKIEFIYNSFTTKIKGNKEKVTSIEYIQNNKKFELKTEAVFVNIGLESNCNFIKKIKKNIHKEIIVDNNTKTSVKGIFCAGDASSIIEKQISIAVGEGSKAALASGKYISKLSF